MQPQTQVSKMIMYLHYTDSVRPAVTLRTFHE